MPVAQRKFVILSVARSGTSLFTGSIHKHPDIYCHGEIFHPKIHEHIRNEYTNQFGIALRDHDPLGFARSVLSFSPNGEIVGFKLWHGQCPGVCDALLADPSVSKIIIERENKLALFSSGQLARASGIWNSQPGADISRLRGVQAGFSRQAFFAFVRRTNNTFRHYRQEARGPVLNMSYTEIARMEFEPVLKFLGASVLPVTAMKQRLHSADILSRYKEDCRGRILTALQRLDKLDWLREDL